MSLTEDATDMQCEDLQKEIKLLSQIPEHTNILPFLGYTTMSGIGTYKTILSSLV